VLLANLCASKRQDLKPYKSVDKIAVLHILIFGYLEGK
jgi:hypothetical protein